MLEIWKQDIRAQMAEVRKLADDIIEAQRLEIDEMKALIADLQGRLH
jgi:uncharacterized protein (DUF305 family)